MAQTRKRRAVSAAPAEPPAKRRYSARLSDEQKEQLRKAVLYLAPRYPDKPYAHVAIFDEARVLLCLNHRSRALQRMFSLWLKDNKDGEWEGMKEQAERDGHEVYFADLIELDSANTEGGGAQVNDGPPRKNARGLTDDEKLAIAKTVLYLALRMVGESRRYKGIQRIPYKIYPVVNELLGLDQNAHTLRIAHQRWLKENKAEWDAMKARSEEEADYFDELHQTVEEIELEEELISQGVLEDTRPEAVPSESGEEEDSDGVDEAQQHRHRYAGPPSSPTRLGEPPHFEQEGEDDSGSDASTLYYDVSRPLPAFDENGWVYVNGEQQEQEEEMEEEEREEAGQPTEGAMSGQMVIVHHHHHHHEHHYHYPVTNYYASGQDHGAHFPPPQ